MKRMCFVLILFLLPYALLAQANVRTEAAQNKYEVYSAATTLDTIVVKAALGDSCTAIYKGRTAYLVGVFIGSPVASDTVTIKNGAGTVTQIILPSSGNAPAYYQFGVRLDTSLVYSQKKASHVTVIYRPGD
jgi:hypothetical protein